MVVSELLCLNLLHKIVSCLIRSYRIFSCLILFYLILPLPILCHPILYYTILRTILHYYPILSYLILSYQSVYPQYVYKHKYTKEILQFPTLSPNKMSNLFQVDHAACIAQLPAHAAQRWPGRHRGDWGTGGFAWLATGGVGGSPTQKWGLKWWCVHRKKHVLAMFSNINNVLWV